MTRLWIILLTLVLAACSSGANAPAPAPAAPDGASHKAAAAFPGWPTYHRTLARSGLAASAPRGRLQRAWGKNLAGAVYGQPLMVRGTLIVATEENNVYALRPRTGTVKWRAHLGTPQPLSGLPCGNIDPLGITGTPAFDASTGSVFVVAETQGGHHTLWALNAATGARRWHKNLDTQPSHNRFAEQQRSALLVANGRVISVFGGLFGDCGDYVGYATSVATNGSGRVRQYAIPTPKRGGMWSPPGPVRGPNGHIYIAAGNGGKLSGAWDFGDSVTELSPVTLRRLSAFAPSTWRDDNAKDLDLGSMSPAVVPSVNRLVIAGKRGVAYLLRPHMGGVGSAIASLRGCTAFGGAAVRGHTVLIPCRAEGAIRALRVGASTLRWSWTADGVYGTPVIAGSRVYVADQQSGDLFVLRFSNGSVVQRLPAGPMPNFPSEIVSGNWVFVPTLDGVTAFRGQ